MIGSKIPSSLTITTAKEGAQLSFNVGNVAKKARRDYQKLSRSLKDYNGLFQSTTI